MAFFIGLFGVLGYIFGSLFSVMLFCVILFMAGILCFKGCGALFRKLDNLGRPKEENKKGKEWKPPF